MTARGAYVALASMAALLIFAALGALPALAFLIAAGLAEPAILGGLNDG